MSTASRKNLQTCSSALVPYTVLTNIQDKMSAN